MEKNLQKNWKMKQMKKLHDLQHKNSRRRNEKKRLKEEDIKILMRKNELNEKMKKIGKMNFQEITSWKKNWKETWKNYEKTKKSKNVQKMTKNSTY